MHDSEGFSKTEGMQSEMRMPSLNSSTPINRHRNRPMAKACALGNPSAYDLVLRDTEMEACRVWALARAIHCRDIRTSAISSSESRMRMRCVFELQAKRDANWNERRADVMQYTQKPA